mgnify:CR=1 FL=1|tara:strand:- start:124 stop:1425 length:1302 start_codon:yes stop_codon:yes gene_type:complete
MTAPTFGVGLIGLGTVGEGVVRLLANAPISMQKRNVKFTIERIAVRDPGKVRKISVDSSVLTGNAEEVIKDSKVDLVIELTGAPPAVEWIRSALECGKDVVTANKAVLSEHGDELFSLALENDVDLMFEASVAGGIPIIRSLRSGLVANQVESLYGILNGTTNYIMTRMTRGEGAYNQILAAAQAKGFAEPDPTMDVSGMDAAQKLSLLSRIAFHTTGTGADVYCEGIENIESKDIENARELGYTIKLLAIAKRSGDQVETRVHPAMVPSESLLANIHDEYNAIEVVGSAVDTQVFYGKGAGQMPTASAVVADLVELGERKVAGAGTAVRDMIAGEEAVDFADVRRSEMRFYLRFLVADQPGVLEQIAHILAQGHISIASVIQKERDLQGGSVPLIIVTHEAKEEAMRKALSVLNRLDMVEEDVVLIRMEELR